MTLRTRATVRPRATLRSVRVGLRWLRVTRAAGSGTRAGDVEGAGQAEHQAGDRFG
ncbi:hypothetical protein GCM10018965_080140 [Nonomuraea roseola]